MGVLETFFRRLSDIYAVLAAFLIFWRRFWCLGNVFLGVCGNIFRQLFSIIFGQFINIFRKTGTFLDIWQHFYTIYKNFATFLNSLQQFSNIFRAIETKWGVLATFLEFWRRFWCFGDIFLCVLATFLVNLLQFSIFLDSLAIF